MTISCNYALTPKNYGSNHFMDTYGITVSYYHSPDIILVKNEDVFADESTAENFCKLINENDVDEVHFKDILEDYLATV